jgi:hypothetical protein
VIIQSLVGGAFAESPRVIVGACSLAKMGASEQKGKTGFKIDFIDRVKLIR